MGTILGILRALLEAFPAIDRILRAFRKTPQQKVDESIEDVREELDEFRRTGRPK
jgi:chromosome condensin MukBEF MukE localization factor